MRLSMLLAATCLLATAGCVTTSPFGLAGPAAQETPAAAAPRQAAVAARQAPPEAPMLKMDAAPVAARPSEPAPDAVIKLSPGSERLAPEMEARLSAIAEQARRDERIMLRLESYVPEGGSPSLNLVRAEQTLQLVKKRLLDLDVNPRRIVLAPFGAEYDTERDERRHWVEIYLIRPRL